MSKKFNPPRKFVKAKPKNSVILIDDDDDDKENVPSTPVEPRNVNWDTHNSQVIDSVDYSTDESSDHSYEADNSQKEHSHTMMAMGSEIEILEYELTNSLKLKEEVTQQLEKVQKENKSLDLQIVILKQHISKLEEALKKSN